MMNTSKRPDYNIASGTIVDGKWHNQRYCIIKSLGYGATGSVYLAQGKDGLVALKISEDSMAITSEVNVLRQLSKVQGCLGPSLLDVDDWLRPGFGRALPFYVMEYVQGVDLLTYIQRNGEEWLGVLILQLLQDLEKLHKEGWVFGDLKPDNLLVISPPTRIRWLDVGGITPLGWSIKEFTEFFDRGYWGLGLRKAEPSYDLFATAMIMINIAYPQRFSKKKETKSAIEQLEQAIQASALLQRFEQLLLKALTGNYQTAAEMKRDLIASMNKRHENRKVYKSSQKQGKKLNTAPLKKKKKQNKWKGFVETVIIAIILLIAYLFYIVGQMI